MQIYSILLEENRREAEALRGFNQKKWNAV
jgi:hypothetical protein